MMTTPIRPLPPAPLRTLALVCATVAGAPLAQAQTSPYYLGLNENIAYDSNLFRLADGAATPSTVQSKSDTVLVTSLVGGVDEPIGRQRVTGSLALRDYRYTQNSDLNYQGYNLAAGLNWSTIHRLSGDVGLRADRTLRKFDNSEQGGSSTDRNIESGQGLSLNARLGVVTRMTLEAGWRVDSTRFSSSAYRGSQNQRRQLSLGARYQPAASWVLGAGLRQGTADYKNASGNYERQDMDLTLRWLPTGKSSLRLRLSHSDTDYPNSSSSNTSGITWEIQGNHQATGKLSVQAALWHDVGDADSVFSQENSTTGESLSGSARFERESTGLRLSSAYAASAKVQANASVSWLKRDLSSSATTVFGAVPDGSDTTTTWSLGLRWAPYRWLTVGSDLSHERRAVNGSVGRPYGAHGLAIWAQAVIQ